MINDQRTLTPPGATAARRTRPLLDQLSWFVRLRWLAGSAVIVGCLIDWLWLGWYIRDLRAAGLGVAILGYNVLLWLALRRCRQSNSYNRRWLLTLSWTQILLDLGCLTAVTLLTGGLYSPVLGFFVFHMVFASLLLPRAMAFGGAGVAILMAVGGLWAFQSRFLPDQLPGRRTAGLIMLGWAVTLLMTVYLTNHITRRLRRQRRRLFRQNRRIRAMTERLARQQQAMLQHEKMVALGQMAAGVAHEIANPLASMDSLLELVQRHPERLQPETARLLREQVQRINQIVQQMKTFAHPAVAEGGEAERLLPVSEVIDQALQIVRYDSRIARTRIERQMAGAPAQAAFRVPGRPLQQVLVNLVLNALDAMADVETPVLTFRVEYSEGWCAVEVKDNGQGILPEHRAQLFEPFFTTKPVGKGTGLGLAVSYSLVRNMGGKIDVQTEPGKGAAFTVRLPVGLKTKLKPVL